MHPNMNSHILRSISLLAFLLLCFSTMSGQAWLNDASSFSPDPTLKPQDRFGTSGWMRDTMLVIGAPGNEYDHQGANRVFASGAAYVYRKNQQGDWEFFQKLVAPIRHGASAYGASVATDGEWVMVGAYLMKVDSVQGSTNVGEVYVYKMDGQDSLKYHSTLLAPNPVPIQEFGVSLALQEKRLLVGAKGERRDLQEGDPLEDAGAAYYFELENDSWNFKQKLVASDRLKDGQFGASLVMDHAWAVIGSPTYDVPSPQGFDYFESGQAYVFEFDSTSRTWTETQILRDQTIDFFGDYGRFLALSGQQLMIGKPKESTLPSGQVFASPGGVEVYEVDSMAQWKLIQELSPPDLGRRTEFGHVAMQGDIALIGALGADFVPESQDSVADAGAVYAFEKQSNGLWQQVNKFGAPTRRRFDGFGFHVLLNGPEAVVLSPYAAKDSVLYDAGAFYVFQRNWPLPLTPAQLPGITLHPNPAGQLLQLSYPGYTLESLRLFDLQGKQYSLPLQHQGESSRIHVSSLPTGLYVVQLRLSDGRYTHLKFLKA
ncbi:MAG: T9SS type A sorting domain-containing protein [Bacteroidota bacterium]